MQRILDILYGPAGEGVERTISFNPPHWMSWGLFTPRIVNTLIFLVAIALVVEIYRRDGRRMGARIGLGILRGLLFLYVLILINQPVLVLTRTVTEPSVLAVLVDDSISMSVPDVNADGTPAERPTGAAAGPSSHPSAGSSNPTRLAAVIEVLNGKDQELLKRLARVHTLRFYSFDKDARPIGSTPGPLDDPTRASAQKDGKDKAPVQIDPKLVEAIRALSPEGKSTQVIPSLVTVLDDLQGQRLAGIVIITDARETPSASSQAMLDRLKKFSTKIYAVPVGSEKAPTNIELASISVQDSAFRGDIVAARVQVRGTGYEPGKTVRVRLLDKKSHLPLKAPDGRDAEKIFVLSDDRTVEEEIPFKADDEGLLEVAAVADLQPGELDDKDNERDAQVAVLNARINVLYVEGYPRWEYRYLKNAMIRDSSSARIDPKKRGGTINISCLLTSADANFVQEGSPPDPDLGPSDPRTGETFPGPITRFPETMTELLKYDVVLFGDVDPRQFTDAQLQMVSDFVNKKGGGFGMVAGPWHSPIAYRNTAIEAVLPVNISRVLPEDPTADYREGFRPLVTDEGRRGEASTIFRFFADKAVNEKYLRDDLQPVFWYCRGVSVKPGVGLVYAEHPFDSDPNTGRRAPILVLGRFGAGRTLFSAIDDTWRWRYYTGESVFDTYWVQQLRYLARSRKLGQRRANFTASRNSYELGDSVTLDLNVMDPALATQLPPQLRVEIVDEATGQTIRQEALQRQEGSPEHFSATFVADRVGKFNVRLPAQLTDSQQGMDPTGPHLEVIVPRLELSKPSVDEQMLQMLSKMSPGNQVVPLAEARVKLPDLIKSAAVTRQTPNPQPLMDGWKALMIFVLLLTSEWVLRKVFGMI